MIPRLPQRDHQPQRDHLPQRDRQPHRDHLPHGHFGSDASTARSRGVVGGP
jgi:hypothetical protein